MMTLKNKIILPAVLLSSAIAWLAAWPPGPVPILLGVILIPVLYLADSDHENTSMAEPWKRTQGTFIFLYFFISQSMAIFWISRITLAGALYPILCGTLVHTLALLFLRKLWVLPKNPFSRIIGSLGFLGFWVFGEWFLEHVLAFPWMNLGFGLSTAPQIIQWYEYTGAMGGTIWILSVNLLGYELLKFAFAQNNPSPTKIRHRFLVWLVVLVAPPLISWMRYQSYETYRNLHFTRNYPHNVHLVLVQSNINPRLEKFDPIRWNNQFQNFLNLSRQGALASSECIIWPETALEPWHGLNEGSLPYLKSINRLSQFLKPYKNALLILGAVTYQVNNQAMGEDTSWFNSAMGIAGGENPSLIHKQILVPGVEKPPFALGYRSIPLPFQYRAWKSKKANTTPNSPLMYLGGIPHYFESDGKNKILYAQSGLGIGVLICFESAFGDYVRGLCLKGAGILVVLSNDAWWGDCPGPYQHRDYERILAIENRRALAQTSNGGFSFIINQKGDILKQLPLGKWGSLPGDLDINEDITFYSQNGELIFYPCLFMFLGALVYIFFPGFRLTGRIYPQ